MLLFLTRIIIRAGQDYMLIGGVEVNYNANFRLYLITNQPNPKLLPAMCIAVIVINFTTTFHGLQASFIIKIALNSLYNILLYT